MHIILSFADDNVENNDQVIMPELETVKFWVISTIEPNKKNNEDRIRTRTSKAKRINSP